MKGALTLAIYIAIGAIPAFAGTAAFGQSSMHYKAPPAGIERPPDIVIIQHGSGGRLDEHNLKYATYRREKTKVRITGPCYSACTLITAYVGKDDLCIAQGAFFAFHAVRSAEKREIMPAETAMMYWQQPVESAPGSTAPAGMKTCRRIRALRENRVTVPTTKPGRAFMFEAEL